MVTREIGIEREVALRVPIEKLRWTCDPSTVPPPEVVSPSQCEIIVGQERALRALRLGLGIEARGYNIFVTGASGTGRTTAVRCLLDEFQRTANRPPDICYVFNFKRPTEPICLKLPAGQGAGFQRDLERRVERLRIDMPSVFNSPLYRERRAALRRGFEDRRDETRAKYRRRLAEHGFDLVENRIGEYTQPDIVPVVRGERVELKELERRAEAGEFSPNEFRRLQTLGKELDPLVEELIAEMKALRRDERRALEDLKRELALPLVKDLVGDLQARYPDPGVGDYLDALLEDVLDNLGLFGESEEESVESASGEVPNARYTVSLLVDNGAAVGRPVVFETAPTYYNLFGMIEKRRGEGPEGADHRDIRAGSLVRANGGYLVLEASDVLNDEHVWATLKRTLRTGKLEIQSYDPQFHYSATALKPVPVDVNVKVIMLGGPDLYEHLWRTDREFTKIFKVPAEFDSVIELKPTNVAAFVGVLEKIRREGGMKPLEPGAVAALVEHGVRLAGRRNKLTAQFGVLGDVMREANYWAEGDNSATLAARHVHRALRNHAHRSSLFEDKIREEIATGDLLIDTAGRRIGQVNGLTIYNLGFYRFGTPVRITAAVSIGRAGIINIEKEVGLSGATYNKGVHILHGFLQDRYARDKPLSVSASLAFEQSYSGVDGDSASSTEVYALLSALSDIPLRQDIAVTGSVNQKGDIQPIGGVNEKIEGWYDVCVSRGLTGTQGVLIPGQNVDNLQLRQDVVETVREGRFHIWAVTTVDEGIELLTGVPAGEREADGSYPAGTVNERVNSTLQRWATTMRAYGTG